VLISGLCDAAVTLGATVNEWVAKSHTHHHLMCQIQRPISVFIRMCKTVDIDVKCVLLFYRDILLFSLFCKICQRLVLLR